MEFFKYIVSGKSGFQHKKIESLNTLLKYKPGYNKTYWNNLFRQHIFQ